ncbi:hypothetical protein [Pseudomonas sp. RIT-PI-S]|uniref:hypothetical protein n=1 Tax=Pseudomonas sp. RIT-PI-S TaxID=3035295 RepID=UPI0021DA575B|nr:hypothetical protein [Pseudomonas sp. RIT-PI-S]
MMTAAPQATSAPTAAANAGVNANPLSSPIRRANPNSRQGSVPSNPAQRQGLQAMPGGRPPTLENGGIGNGQRFPAPAPAPMPAKPGERR